MSSAWSYSLRKFGLPELFPNVVAGYRISRRVILRPCCVLLIHPCMRCLYSKSCLSGVSSLVQSGDIRGWHWLWNRHRIAEKNREKERTDEPGAKKGKGNEQNT